MYHVLPVRMPKIQSFYLCVGNVARRQYPLELLLGMQNGTVSMGSNAAISLNIGNTHTLWTTSFIPGKWMYTYSADLQKDTCSWVFSAVLFEMAEDWKEPSAYQHKTWQTKPGASIKGTFTTVRNIKKHHWRYEIWEGLPNIVFHERGKEQNM